MSQKSQTDQSAYKSIYDKIPFEKVVRYGKVLIFCLLILVSVILAVGRRGVYFYGVKVVWVVMLVEVALVGENAVKLWALKSYKKKIVCYVLDIVLLLFLTFLTDGTLISTLYIIILSEFYLGQKDMRGNIAMGVCSITLYLSMFAISNVLKDESVYVELLISNLFNDLVLLVLHFLVINFLVQIYRKNLELNETLQELHESNQKLIEANKELKTMAVLEERQRIAKEIHDTAGHSITTIIMQTEAARLALDKNPKDARQKLVAANLQAKHALEELRKSVHLLSGRADTLSLKESLSAILMESSDGTDVTFRSDIDDVTVSEGQQRFLCNALREGISNGLRHGGATAFYFECKEEEGTLHFLLSDNGSGAEGGFEEGFGLTEMRKQGQRLFATVTADGDEEGFELKISMPYNENIQDGEDSDGTDEN